jgi:carbohydrate kinase (thermoresistant glucokinase family)
VARLDDVLIVMGPSGCGKSTLAAALAEELGWAVVEGDLYHSEKAKALMSRGIGLTDEMREPWLGRVAAAVIARDEPKIVVACSSLSQRVRDLLQKLLLVEPRFILPHVPEDELARRLSERKNHFARTALLASQMQSLEVTPDILVIDGENSTEKQVREIKALLGHNEKDPPERAFRS